MIALKVFAFLACDLAFASLLPCSAEAQTGPFPSALGNGILGHFFQEAPFQGINLADIAVFALLGFVAWRLWLSLKDGKPPRSQEKDVTPREASEAYRRAAQTWEHLSSKPKGSGVDQTAGSPDYVIDHMEPLPAGFDSKDFLKGAKMFYARFKESWDQRDLDDLAQFTAPGMYRELQAQAEANPGPTQTTVLTLEARLIQAKQETGVTTAEVAYKALLQEQGDQKPKEVHEVWRFSRQDDRKSSWRLESMERVQ